MASLSGRRRETEYGVKLFLPLGGYVKITGMSRVEEIDPAGEHRTYRGKPFWQKSLVVLAGLTLPRPASSTQYTNQ